MDSIYIKTLKLGFENPGGISLDDIVKKLNIKLSDNSFKFNYTLWFYSNFYNPKTESYVIATNTQSTSPKRLTPDNMTKFTENNKSKSYIKGDAINKYIDYVELSLARSNSIKASQSASKSLKIANRSLCIAIAAVVIQILFGLITYIFPSSKPERPKVFNNKYEINENPFDEFTDPLDTSIIKRDPKDTSTNKHGSQSKQLIN